MAAVIGTFFFDMRPAGECVPGLRAGLESLAAGEASVVCEDGIAMGIGAWPVWETAAPAPVRSPSGRLLSFDGRLDNRDDLGLQLGGRFTRETDAEIALAAFDRWGIDGLGRLVGEWSAAIWDAPLRTIHLARDYMGVRPLFVAAGSQSVMWSTNLGELAQRAGRANALSEDFVATAITQEISPEITPYHGIRAVPPGTCLSWSAERPERAQRFWSFGSSVIRFRREHDYEEAFRALWEEAVRTRLRTTRTVWAEISGGLDSSSVVCMADAVMRAGRVPAPSLRLISHATLESPEGDERRFIAAIEERVGVRSDVLGVEAHRDLVDERWDWVSPFAARGVLLACLHHIGSAGGHLVLSGRMGDAVTGCQPDNSLAVFDELADRGAVAALAATRRWSRATRQPFAHTALHLLRWLTDPAFAEPRSDAGDPAALLTPRLRSLARDRTAPLEHLDGVRAAKRRLARMLLGYARSSRLDLPLHPPGIVYSYPFSHRPLVEFMFAIPGDVVTAPGETRSLMRRAFTALLPPRVLSRQSKGYYPPSALRGLRQSAARMFPVDRLECVRRGWIDAKALDSALRPLVDAGVGRADLRRVIRLEEWLDSRLRRGPAATPRRKEVKTNEVHHA